MRYPVCVKQELACKAGLVAAMTNESQEDTSAARNSNADLGSMFEKSQEITLLCTTAGRDQELFVKPSSA